MSKQNINSGNVSYFIAIYNAILKKSVHIYTYLVVCDRKDTTPKLFFHTT